MAKAGETKITRKTTLDKTKKTSLIKTFLSRNKTLIAYSTHQLNIGLIETVSKVPEHILKCERYINMAS